MHTTLNVCKFIHKIENRKPCDWVQSMDHNRCVLHSYNMTHLNISVFITCAPHTKSHTCSFVLVMSTFWSIKELSVEKFYSAAFFIYFSFSNEFSNYTYRFKRPLAVSLWPFIMVDNKNESIELFLCIFRLSTF